jgi:hypothetical protein
MNWNIDRIAKLTGLDKQDKRPSSLNESKVAGKRVRKGNLNEATLRRIVREEIRKYLLNTEKAMPTLNTSSPSPTFPQSKQPARKYAASLGRAFAGPGFW